MTGTQGTNQGGDMVVPPLPRAEAVVYAALIDADDIGASAAAEMVTRALYRAGLLPLEEPS